MKNPARPQFSLTWGLLATVVVLLLGLGGWLGVQQNRLLNSVLDASSIVTDGRELAQLQRQMAIFQSEVAWAAASGRIRNMENLQFKWDLVWSRWNNVRRGETRKAVEKIPSQLNQLPQVAVLIDEVEAALATISDDPARTAGRIFNRLEEAIRLSQETKSHIYNAYYARIVSNQETLKAIQQGSAAIGVLAVILVGLLLIVMWRNHRRQLDQVYGLVESLQRSEERFRNLEQGSLQGIIVHRDGRPLFANQTFADLFGFASPEEVIARGSVSAFAEAGADSRLGGYSLEQLNADEKLALYTFKGLRKDGEGDEDGEALWLETWDRVVNWEGGPAIQSTLVDISEHQKAEQELSVAKETAEMATEEKDKFVSLIAHDLKAPFSSIFSFLDLLELEGGRGASTKQLELIPSLRRRCQHAMETISDVLRSSRFTGGTIQLNPTFLNGSMEALLAKSNFTELAQEKGIEIINEVPEGTRIYADSGLLGEVLHNLVSNAVKFCSEGDKVTIFVPEGDTPGIAIKDTGSGIDPKLLPDLFRRDVNTSTVGTGGEVGTGLALPICKDIVEAHGGTLEVETIQGEGSIFTVRLPYCRPNILVVDDEEVNRCLLKTQLAMIDVEVSEAASGEEIQNEINSHWPNLILLDLHLPDKVGFEVLRQLKQDAETRTIPVIIITSDSRMATRQKAIELGAVDFIEKPVKSVELIPRVRRFVA